VPQQRQERVEQQRQVERCLAGGELVRGGRLGGIGGELGGEVAYRVTPSGVRDVGAGGSLVFAGLDGLGMIE